MVIMLYRTDIFALVGSDSNNEHKSNELMIWDDYKKSITREMKFGQKILNVKLRKDKIIVVFHDKIHVFELPTFKQIDTIETGDNETRSFELTKQQIPHIFGFVDIKYNSVKLVGIIL